MLPSAGSNAELPTFNDRSRRKRRKRSDEESERPVKRGKGGGADDSTTDKMGSMHAPVTVDSACEEELAKMVSDVLQANDPAMRDLTRIARKLQGLKLSRIVTVVPTEKSEIRLEQQLDGPRVREIQPLSYRRKKTHWEFLFCTAGSNTEEKGTSVQVSYAAVHKETSTEVLTRLHHKLAEMWCVWPWPISKVQPPVTKQWVLAACSELWARTLVIDEVQHGNEPIYRTKISYIDATTGGLGSMTVSATPTDALMDKVTVPARPIADIRQPGDTFVRIGPSQPHYIGLPQFKKQLGPRQKISQRSRHKAQDAVYWMAAQLQGLVATEARMKELYVLYRKQIGLQKSHQARTGLYGGEADLYSIACWRIRQQTHVTPTKVISKDLGLTIVEMTLHINSLNASRTTAVLETLVQLFCDGRDIRYAWLSAARVADCVNMDIRDGVPPSSRCDCDDSATSTEMHACEGCGCPVLCETRRQDCMGRLVCVTCFRREENSTPRGFLPGESLAACLARLSLRKSFRHECAAQGLNPERQDVRHIVDQAWQTLQPQLHGDGKVQNLSPDRLTKYTDGWTGIEHDVGEERAAIGSNPSRRRYVPHGLVVDAVQRQGRPEYYDMKHSPNNLQITSNGCNMARSIFNVGVLHEIGEFKRMSLVHQSLDQHRQALIHATTSMAEVHYKRAYINAGPGSKAAKYQKIHAESVAGRTTPDEPGPWEQRARRYTEKQVTPYLPGQSVWEDAIWARLQKCAKSMEEFFEVELYRVKDNTIWFGTDYSIPDDLDRNGIAILCNERLYRMRTCCNKKWMTQDSAETLYLEILFQHCCSVTAVSDLQWLRIKYGDRLGLPLVLWKLSPLRFSIAHRNHGYGMFTGWPENPVNVNERIDNDANNNMLVESWYLNCAKFDIAEEYYDDLMRILAAAKVTDRNVYNPGAQLAKGGAVPSISEKLDEPQEQFTRPAFNTLTDEDAQPDDQAGAGNDHLTNPGDGNTGGDDIDDVDADEADVYQYSSGDFEGDLQEGVAEVYKKIMAKETLRTLLIYDPEFRTELAKLQANANKGDEETFEECMGLIFEQWINPAQ